MIAIILIMIIANLLIVIIAIILIVIIATGIPAPTPTAGRALLGLWEYSSEHT